MIRSLTLSSLVGLLAGATVAAQTRTAPAAPAPMPSIAGKLHRNTAFVLRISSLDKLAQSLRNLAPYRIWEEEEVQTFWQSVREKLVSEMGGRAGDMGDLLATMNALRLGFAGPITFAGEAKDDSGREVRAALVLEGCTLGDQLDAVLEARHRGPLSVILRGGTKAEDAGGVKVRTHPHPALDLVSAVAGTTLAIGEDRDFVVRLARDAGKDTTGTLAANESFQRSWAASGAREPLLFAFLNVGLAVDSQPEGDRAEIGSLGLDNVRGLGVALWTDGDEAIDRVYLDIPGGRKGLLLGAAPGPTKAKAASIAPATTLLMAACPIDPVALYRNVKDIAEARQQTFLAEAEKALLDSVKLRLTEDLLQPMGKEITFLVILPSSGALIPEFAALVEVRGEHAMEANLNSLITNTLGLKLKETKFGSRTIRYWQERGEGFFALNVNPGYAITNGYLVLGSHPNAVKRVLQTIDGKQPALDKQEPFQKALARTLADGEPAGLVYFDTKRTFEYVHGIVTPILNLVGDRNHMPFDPATLPTAESVSKHLSVAVNALRLHKEAIEVRSFSDGLSLSMVMIGGAGVALAFGLNDLVSGRHGETYSIHWQLESFHQGITRHRTEHKTLPATIADIPERYEGERQGEADRYRYYPEESKLGAKESFPAGTILVYEKEPGARGCRFFLTVDGRIDWLPEEEFQKRLREQPRQAGK